MIKNDFLFFMIGVMIGKTASGCLSQLVCQTYREVHHNCRRLNHKTNHKSFFIFTNHDYLRTIFFKAKQFV